ncbi:MAG: MFS transporter [Actinomycetota bacterium]
MLTEQAAVGSAPSSSPTRARAAVIVHFLCTGSVLGVWAARLPAVKHGLRIHDGDIGLVLFVGAFGALLSLRAAGRLIERYGSRRTTQFAGVVLTASFVLSAGAWNLTGLAVALFVISSSASLQDVAMNAQAVAIEHRLERPIMSSFHAAFSLGGIVGAAIGAATAKLGVSYRSTFAGVSAVLFLTILVANRWVLDAPETRRRPHDVERDRTRLPERKALLALGFIAFVSFIAEGAAADWTTIYLRDNTSASAATAAVGFVVFSGTMTAGRLSGDRVAARFGALPLIRLGTGVAGAGLLFAVAIGSTAAGFVGFALLGIGLSIVVPQVFSAAGALAPGRAARALSTVSSIAYLGFLAGPATIGVVARQVNLRVALLIPAALVLGGSLLASRLHGADGRAQA